MWNKTLSFPEIGPPAGRPVGPGEQLMRLALLLPHMWPWETLLHASTQLDLPLTLDLALSIIGIAVVAFVLLAYVFYRDYRRGALV